MWGAARMAAVAAVLAMPVGAVRADTVLPDNGPVEFYDSTGEASFGISVIGSPLNYSLAPPNYSYYEIQATFSLYDANGNLIPAPFDPAIDAPTSTAQLVADTCKSCYFGLEPDRGIEYIGLLPGYYTVVFGSSIVIENDLVSPLTYTLTGDITPTPLPAALPLFVSGLGALGLFGWRRKRKASAAIAA